jgi:hypothetical protein
MLPESILKLFVCVKHKTRSLFVVLGSLYLFPHDVVSGENWPQKMLPVEDLKGCLNVSKEILPKF